MIAIILVLSKIASLQGFAVTIDTRQLAYSFASQSISQKQETRLAAYNEMKEIFSEFQLRTKMDSKEFSQVVQNNEALRAKLLGVASKYKIEALNKVVTRRQHTGPEDEEEGGNNDTTEGRESDEWG